MSSTSAIRSLRIDNVQFTEHEYRYEEHGGTRAASSQLGVDEHAIVKTLVMEDETGEPVVVLMHGDREISTKQLARSIGRKSLHERLLPALGDLLFHEGAWQLLDPQPAGIGESYRGFIAHQWSSRDRRRLVIVELVCTSGAVLFASGLACAGRLFMGTARSAGCGGIPPPWR